ncbi:MAG TPA: protein kinase [Candidatus Binataceae bacterium]|nr:protein kinase [Candidatus Binataceae bacterium]
MIDPNTILSKRYRVVRPLGGGGMKQVYLAEDTRLANRQCALAEMIEAFADPAEAQAAATAFEREADLLAQLSHDRIVRVYDKFSEANRHYLVMEHVQGETLDERLAAAANGRLDEKFVIDVARQILTALEYLHGCNPPIVYRDLKPANVMVTGGGDVKLIDFGVARLFMPKKTATMVGTMGYAPPEQYEGRAEPRSDVYALGATMFHLLTGWDPGQHAPFMIPPIGTIRKDLNPSLAAILTESLILDPNQRISSAAAFRRSLESISQPSGASARTTILKPSIPAAANHTADKAAAASAPTVISAHRLQCPRCGRAVTLAVRYCTYCKADLKAFSEGKAKTIQPAVQWTYSTSGRVSAISPESGGIIYAAIADARGSESHLHALDAASGQSKWSFSAHAAISSVVVAPNGTPYAAVAGEGLEGGALYSLTPAHGSPRRAYAAAYVSSALAIGRDETIYVAIGPPDAAKSASGSHVQAIKAGSRTRKWSFSIPYAITAIAVAPDGRSVYAAAENLIYSLDSADGNCKWKFVTGRHLRWSVELNGEADREWTFVSGSHLLAMTVGRDGAIYAGSDDGNLYVVGPYGDWRWSYAAGAQVNSIVAPGGGIIYLAAGKKVSAIGDDGLPKWSFSAADSIGPIATGRDGVIYAATGGRSIYAFSIL